MCNNLAMVDLQGLRVAAAAARDSVNQANEDRAMRNHLIFQAVIEGLAQADICRATDLTREHIRRIVGAERKRQEVSS